jgi:hypothetical protein
MNGWRNSVGATHIFASYNLAEIFGLVFSCKQIFSEFENEWSTAFSKHVQDVIFQASDIARYIDSMLLQTAESEPETWSLEVLRQNIYLVHGRFSKSFPFVLFYCTVERRSRAGRLSWLLLAFQKTNILYLMIAGNSRK